MKRGVESVANNAIDWQGLWNYLFGTNQPPAEAVEHGQPDHLHLDRGSGRWVAPEEAREKTAA
jgi:hypothetical protein